MRYLVTIVTLSLAPLSWGEEELVLYCVRESANQWEYEKEKQNYERSGFTYSSSPDFRFTLKASKDSVSVRGLENVEEALIDYPFVVQYFVVQPLPNMFGGGTSFGFEAHSNGRPSYELKVRGTYSDGFFYRIIKKSGMTLEMFTDFGTCTKF